MTDYVSDIGDTDHNTKYCRCEFYISVPRKYEIQNHSHIFDLTIK